MSSIDRNVEVNRDGKGKPLLTATTKHFTSGPVRVMCGKLIPVQAAILVIAIWQGLIALGFNGILPHAWDVGKALVSLISDGGFYTDLAISLFRAFTGYIIGALIGISLGLLGLLVPWLGQITSTILVWLRPLPPIALAPFFILVAGLGELSKVALVAYGSVFPVWLATANGLSLVSQKFIWTAQSLGASRLHVVLWVMLPASLPHILTGLRTAIGVAFTCLVGAEISGAMSGIMYRIELSRVTYSISTVVAGLVVLAVIGAVADSAFRALSRKLVPWSVANRHGSGDEE